jgi:D-serine dehydratase
MTHDRHRRHQLHFNDPLLGSNFKGYPRTQAPRLRSEVGAAGWNVLAGDLPLPLAMLKREALEHNLAWMQSRVREWGIDLAPHGKTSMSPQLFQRQLNAGAWGLTFATVTQLAVGVAAGARRTLIANQVVSDEDLAGIQLLLSATAGLRIVFLVDSLAQLALIEDWAKRHPASVPFEVMIEIGVEGARTGCRTHEEAVTLATRLRASDAVKLVGIETYEGQGATGVSEPDTAYANTLMDRVEAIARHCDTHKLFETDEVLVSAGGSAIFDLVAGRLKPALGSPVRGLLALGLLRDARPWLLQAHGERGRRAPGLRMRRRPASRDGSLGHGAIAPRAGPGDSCGGQARHLLRPLDARAHRARGTRRAQAEAVPAGWKITALNDQHAYLRWDASEEAEAPAVGDRVGLGISHPCTTFDKWHWMPVVENDYRVSDAVAMHF